MLNKSIFKISFLTAGNITNALLGFAFITAAAKTLPLDVFGKYALLTSLLVSLAKIMDFGTNSIYVAQALSKSKEMQEKFLGIKLLLFAISIPISLGVLYFLNLDSPIILMMFAAGLIAYGLNFTMYAFFHRAEKFEHLLLLNTLPATIKGLFAVGIFLGALNLDINQFFAVFALSMFSSLFLAFFVPYEKKDFKISFNNILPILKNAFPAGVSQIVNEGWPAITNSIAKLAKGFTDVGIFSLADKVSDIFSLASLSIFTVLLPKNANRKRNNLQFDAKEAIILGSVILAMAVAAITVSGFFLKMFFGDKFAGSIPLLNILILTSAITAIVSFMENYFYVEDETHYLLRINIGKLSTLLVCSFFLVPYFGLFGLAYSSLSSSIVALLITVVAVKTHSRA